MKKPHTLTVSCFITHRLKDTNVVLSTAKSNSKDIYD